ncbi:MAG: anti-sigma factor [Gemmatimonadales bacterium]
MSDAPDSLRELVPGYALGTLSPEELRAFEAALAGSPELRRELAEFREVGALLAVESAASPRPELKALLLERIRAARSAELPAPPRTRARPEARATSRNVVTRLLGLGLAASLLLAAALFLRVRSIGERLARADSTAADLGRRLAGRDATLNAILEPGVQLTTLTATGQAPVVQVFWDRPRNRAVLHAFRLPPAPAGRTYQLWLMRKSASPIPSRLFDTEADGHALAENIEVPAGESIVGFAISVEPAGGSSQPTTSPILFGATASQ